MNGALANFRELKGIGPTTEARLHEAGIYTWEALAAAATALAAVRGDGDTLRDVAALVSAQTGHGGDDPALHPEVGERLEAFVLRMAVGLDGQPRRLTATHVRTMTEHAWPGWAPAELAGFVVEQSGLELGGSPEPARDGVATVVPSASGGSAPPGDPASPRTAGNRAHVVVLEAGKVIGGYSRDITFRVGAPDGPATGFDCRATLLARPLGAADAAPDWTAVGERRATGSPAGDLALPFSGVELAPGIHRLRLHLELTLGAPAVGPPALALVRRADRAG